MVVTYKIQVHTEDWAFAGTTHDIYLKLIGTEGRTDSILIPLSSGRYSQGSLGTLHASCPESLGQLFLVELEIKSHLLPVLDDWFCSKIVVTTPEGETIVFPVHRWLSCNQPFAFRDGIGKLIFNDKIPEALKNRQEELEYRRKTYKWSHFADGLPETVTANLLSLPREDRFSFTKGSEFIVTMSYSMAQLGFEGLIFPKHPWSTVDAIHAAHVGTKTAIHEYVETHWKEDEFFAYEFLNGLNPMLIHRLRDLPKKFPVTEDMVKKSLRGGVSLEEELKSGSIFLVDYKLLDGVEANIVNDKQQYLAAPLILLYLNPDNKLMPIAIQLKQEPGDENPIFLPTDSEYDWLLAKIFVRAADFADHGFHTHLLRAHLLSEVFAMATLRNFPMVHPLYKLLTPHFRYTLQIDTQARATLISEKGVYSKYAAAGGPGMLVFMRKAMSSLTYRSLCLPDNITERGLDEVPNFYYRDDGLKLWREIFSYVEGVVGYYYSTDSDVGKDTELQNWIQESFKSGFLSRKESGIPESFSSVEELVKFLTMVIFTASAQHGALNNGLFDFWVWMPNAPISLQLPPPTTKGQSTESIMLQTFPDINATANGMGLAYLLSQRSTDSIPLGQYPVELFVEETPMHKIKDFQERLKAVKKEIATRNSTLKLPYIYLDPDNVENSIAY